MDQNQNAPLFGLNIDPNSKSLLTEIAKWARFLAIVGFIVCGLVVIAGIVMAAAFNSVDNPYDDGSAFMAPSAGIGVAAIIMYILVALIYFFPTLYLYRFGVRMRNALASSDQNTFNDSLSNLKASFRFVGILVIIMISLWILGFVLGILTASSM